MFLTLLAVLAAQPTPDALAEGSPEILTVGTYAYPRFDRGAALLPLAELVERTARRPVRLVLMSTPDALASAVCAGKVDVAMTNLGAFVQVRDCRDVRPVAVLDTPAAILADYRGVLLARRDVRVASLADIAGKAASLRYSEVLPGSTSGALVQKHVLREAQVKLSDFAATRHSGTHEAALEDLLAGRADLAGLAEEPWRKLQAADPAKARTLLSVWRSEPLPPGPVVCRERSAVPCADIGSALLYRGAEVAMALAAGWTETRGARGFRPFEPKDYAAFRAD